MKSIYESFFCRNTLGHRKNIYFIIFSKERLILYRFKTFARFNITIVK